MSAPPKKQCQTALRLEPLPVDYRTYRREVILDCYKWDPQVGDCQTVADHAVVLSDVDARRLVAWSEALAGETVALESALVARPDLHAELALPRPLLTALRQARAPVRHRDVRVMRFDFHPTRDGWSLSEVNSDVPGGFAEAHALPRLTQRYLPGTAVFGDVAGAIVSALQHLCPQTNLALVFATSYSDDRQVMQYLADRFAEGGFTSLLCAPDHIDWLTSSCRLDPTGATLGAVVRFFPVEWLPNLARGIWEPYFDNVILACNPATAILTQSKRLPLIWDKLGVSIPTWRALLPETVAASRIAWKRDESWLLKPALGRVGEGIGLRDTITAKEDRQIQWDARLHPKEWVAQRRFDSMPLSSVDGPRHLCIGVFTVNGQARGFYGRLARKPRVDKEAQDIAVLVESPLEAAA